MRTGEGLKGNVNKNEKAWGGGGGGGGGGRGRVGCFLMELFDS